jgi:hypothetical protein
MNIKIQKFFLEYQDAWNLLRNCIRKQNVYFEIYITELLLKEKILFCTSKEF